MEPPNDQVTVLSEEASRRQDTKERVYVLFQSCGWLSVLVIQLVVHFGLSTNEISTDEAVFNVAVLVMVLLLGWLISHYTRYFIARWGWKQLGWRALFPRVLVTSVVGSTIWVLVCNGYLYGLVQVPWTAKQSFPVLAVLSWVNGIIMLSVWLCFYFFYHLFDRFNRSEVERAQLATSAKEAELRSLKSQVNPHFIFNSLNSLRALIDEDPGRARQSVTQLANLLRYSLQSSQLQTVPLEDELRVVNDYLALEQVRHEERLRVRLDIAPETLQLPIPPMLLQTLVENAVKYGISTQPDGGEITIEARQENGALSLRVTNPGSLPDAAHPTRATNSTGVGLKNAGERLRLLFGEAAKLKLRAAAPGRVVAEAILPLRRHPV